MESIKPIIVERIVKKVVRTPKNPNYNMKCVICGDVFQSTRKTARFCSDYCYNQYREGNNSSETPKKASNTPKKLSVNAKKAKELKEKQKSIVKAPKRFKEMQDMPGGGFIITEVYDKGKRYELYDSNNESFVEMTYDEIIEKFFINK